MTDLDRIFRPIGRCLVTGAGSGIGEAIARRLNALGVDVVVSDRTSEDSERIARALGADAAPMDITRPDEVSRAFATVGPLDAVVHAAGAGAFMPILDMTPADWRATVATDLDGAFYVLQAGARAILRNGGRGGSIVLVSSVNARFVHRGLSAYAAAKAGVEQLARVAALELGEAGIRVNAVAPGAVDTPMAAGVIADPDLRRAFEQGSPFGRIARPDDIADPVLFLLSAASRWLTGQTITVDGGMSLRVEPHFTSPDQWTARALVEKAA